MRIRKFEIYRNLEIDWLPRIWLTDWLVIIYGMIGFVLENTRSSMKKIFSQYLIYACESVFEFLVNFSELQFSTIFFSCTHIVKFLFWFLVYFICFFDFGNMLFFIFPYSRASRLRCNENAWYVSEGQYVPLRVSAITSRCCIHHTDNQRRYWFYRLTLICPMSCPDSRQAFTSVYPLSVSAYLFISPFSISIGI